MAHYYGILSEYEELKPQKKEWVMSNNICDYCRNKGSRDCGPCEESIIAYENFRGIEVPNASSSKKKDAEDELKKAIKEMKYYKKMVNPYEDGVTFTYSTTTSSGTGGTNQVVAAPSGPTTYADLYRPANYDAGIISTATSDHIQEQVSKLQQLVERSSTSLQERMDRIGSELQKGKEEQQDKGFVVSLFGSTFKKKTGKKKAR